MAKTHKDASRGEFVTKLSRSGVVVSKTGGARRDPMSIVSSGTAQKQLEAVSRIQAKKK